MKINFKILKTVEFSFLVIVSIYSLISAYFFLTRNAGSGDEMLFMNDLDFIKTEGWNNAVRKNISIPYMLLVYPLSLFLKNFIVLRLVNVLIVSSLFFYFFKRIKKQLPFYGFLLFFISTVGYFYFGTNDSLFFVALIIFLCEVFFLIGKGEWNATLALSALTIAFFARELILVYTPVILICFYIIYHKKGFSNLKWYYPLGLVALFLVLNLPSLTENGNLSYDLKSPPQSAKSNWVQRQYLAQLMVNKGELPNHNHPSWEQTDAYLKANGENSLPKGIISGVLFDIKLTVKEFFKDFFECTFFGFRQLGFILLLTFFFGARGFIRERKINESTFIPLILMMMLSIFSFIIISFVELRWLAPVFIASILYYWNLQHKKSINKNMVIINYAILILMSLYGSFNLCNKIISNCG
ncbi:hypothetical protein SAMN05660845_2058 [Flavobacterium swingsii]|uniref:Dolichyl-phosphate-mannose-protein mannosyltransferase n=1 Tax=Flavobacterium swingsii TaxID=498292 RepID=A0A1I0Z6M0_9FLAO|nr:hypothetical protein [Flavobacterium swingsii]SFB21234.1 hypothetical protein SAMN05660845_2058 [Flavobacterium swingsii]